MRETVIVKSFNEVPKRLCHFPIFVIYNSPTDFPGQFVVRLFDVDQPTPYALCTTTLEEAREKVPEGKYNIGRVMEEDPKIEEIWV